MEKIVKYNNYMNKLTFTDFTEVDLNFLMAVCSRMKELGEETQVFEYDTIMDLIKWDRKDSVKIFHKNLMRMCDKLRKIGTTVEISEGVFASFDLFPTFLGNLSKRQLTVRVNPDFKFILNDLQKNFTRFELGEYIKLDGRYPKMLYQRLKQFKLSGWWQVSVEEFRVMMDIPSAYQIKHIMDKVIKPSIKTIRTCKGFSDLSVEVIRSQRRGRPVSGYKFSWTADKQIPGQMKIYELLKDDDGQEKESKIVHPKSKNRFNNFPQRKYEKGEFDQFISNH